MATPNMALDKPTEGGSDDVWDTDWNNNADTIDAHDHSSGKGVPVPTAGINIDADLDCNDNGLTSVKSVAMSNQSSGSISGEAFYTRDSPREAYYRDNSGTHVQLTDGGKVARRNASTTLCVPGVGLHRDSGYALDFNGFITSGAGSQRAWIYIPAWVSGKIDEVHAEVEHGSSGTITLEVFYTSTAGARTTVATTNHAGTGAQTLSITGLDHTVVTSRGYWVSVTSGAASDKIYQVRLKVIDP